MIALSIAVPRTPYAIIFPEYFEKAIQAISDTQEDDSKVVLQSLCNVMIDMAMARALELRLVQEYYCGLCVEVALAFPDQPPPICSKGHAMKHLAESLDVSDCPPMMKGWLNKDG